jgi:hypothetical protein
MANTYTLIEAKTLATAVATVQFTSIPQTYTDLKLVYSVRNSGSADPWYQVLIQFNSDSTAANYPYRYIYGLASSAGSGTGNQAVGYSVSSSATANTFSNGEIYIPNYTNSSNYKSISGDVVNENNASTNIVALYATLWQGTPAAITSLTLTQTANNFVQYSTFYLYGIKNS